MFVRLRDRLRRSDDDGFSLIESVVALMIATVVFTALAAASISSLKAVLVGRSLQQASDVADKSMEAMRAYGYDALYMKDSDLAVNDPLNLTTTSRYDPVRNVVSSTGERIATDPAGTVSPHVSVVRAPGGGSYTVRRYVTWASDADGTTAQGTEYKRLTVVVSWDVRGVKRTRIVSSLIAAQRSGLPLPDYKFAANGPTGLCVSPGTSGVLGFILSNNGARDSWGITSAGGVQVWSYYFDDGTVPGSWDTSDTALPTPGGVATVGPIDPTQSVRFWARTTTVPSTLLGTSTVTFTATSVAQPTYSTALPAAFQVATLCAGVPTPTPTASPTGTATATPSPTPTSTSTPPATPVSCAATKAIPVASANGNSVTPVNYLLTNGTSNLGNTTATSPLPMNKNLATPSSSTLWNYSTDLSASSAGRHLAPSLAASAATLATTSEWRYQFPADTQLKGDGVVVLWAAPASGLASTTLGLTVKVQKLSSAGALLTTIATVPYDPETWNCAGFKQFGVAIDYGNSGTDFAANTILSIQVTAQGSPALLGYDTTTFDASAILPVKG